MLATACRVRLVMGIELHRASEAPPCVVRRWSCLAVDKADCRGDLGKADHECLRWRRSGRLHRRPPARSADRERTLLRTRTPIRRLPQPIGVPTDIPRPSPIPSQTRTATDPSGCSVSNTNSALFFTKQLRAARSTIASVGPSTAAAIRNGSDIRNAAGDGPSPISVTTSSPAAPS